MERIIRSGNTYIDLEARQGHELPVLVVVEVGNDYLDVQLTQKEAKKLGRALIRFATEGE